MASIVGSPTGIKNHELPIVVGHGGKSLRPDCQILDRTAQLAFPDPSARRRDPADPISLLNHRQAERVGFDGQVSELDQAHVDLALGLRRRS